ncbi:probable UDP-sugar transporter protein SLC35A4 isoform X2 [Lineus longissimus]
MLLMGVAIYGSYTIFVHLCEVDGKMPFSSASMVLLTEITKLVISICMFIPEIREKGFQMPPLSFAVPFAVPALLYCINNNLCVHMQLQMDPASYQVLCNLKILSTAFLYRLIIKRRITPIQWTALAMLAVAGACNSYGGFHAKATGTSASIIHITHLGLVMISCYCFISGLSGVYTEYVLKRHYQTSLHLQNSLLYTFGIMLNGGAWVTEAIYSKEADSFNLFRGYSVYTVLIILSQAMIGLIMSAVMKHANNIVRLFLISTAMVVTTVLSMLIFNLQLNAYFCASFCLVFIALALYHKN